MRNTEVADHLKKRVAQYYLKKRRISFYELGLTRGGKLRADVFVLAMSGHMVIVECKSSVADFKSFPAKADGYAQYCNQLYLAVYKPVYEKIKNQIPPFVGCFVFDPEDGRRKPTIKKAKNREIHEDEKRKLFIRAAFRNADNSNRKNKGHQKD